MVVTTKEFLDCIALPIGGDTGRSLLLTTRTTGAIKIIRNHRGCQVVHSAFGFQSCECLSRLTKEANSRRMWCSPASLADPSSHT